MDMGPGAPTPSLVTQGIATGREKVLAPVPIQEIPEVMSAPVEVFTMTPLVVFSNPSPEPHGSRHRKSTRHNHYCP
jgi:hypothetical protein